MNLKPFEIFSIFFFYKNMIFSNSYADATQFNLIKIKQTKIQSIFTVRCNWLVDLIEFLSGVIRFLIIEAKTLEI